MGRGTENNPYTREDVLRLIEENGGKAEGLDLAYKFFQKGIDLRSLDLSIIDLSESRLVDAHLEEADLSGAVLMKTVLLGAHLERANLSSAHLWEANLNVVDLREANLRYAELWETRLRGAELEGTDLRYAELGGAFLEHTDFPYSAKLEEIDWGENHILGEERAGLFDSAEPIYRRLKIWHTEHGLHDIAAQFYYREKEVGRKDARRRRDRITKWFSWAFFGHGERWRRILIWIAGCILFFTLIYFFTGKLTLDAFLHSLYYSAASFITLGYGGWIQEASGWTKGLGVFEAFLGFFMMTLLLVTFVRKWTR